MGFKNPYITMEFIEAHPEYDWKWDWVSDNPNLYNEIY